MIENRSKLDFSKVFGLFLKKFLLCDPYAWFTDIYQGNFQVYVNDDPRTYFLALFVPKSGPNKSKFRFSIIFLKSLHLIHMKLEL